MEGKDEAGQHLLIRCGLEANHSRYPKPLAFRAAVPHGGRTVKLVRVPVPDCAPLLHLASATLNQPRLQKERP